MRIIKKEIYNNNKKFLIETSDKFLIEFGNVKLDSVYLNNLNINLSVIYNNNILLIFQMFYFIMFYVSR